MNVPLRFSKLYITSCFPYMLIISLDPSDSFLEGTVPVKLSPKHFLQPRK